MKRAAPALIVLVLALLPLFGMEPRVYVTLTVAGLAMGMLIFLVAAGLTLIFGLMDVLNFAHRAGAAWGASVGFSVALLLNQRWGWAAAPSVPLNVLLLAASILAAMVVAVGLGILLERVIVRPVYSRATF